jgi:hypothetical protein
VLIEAGADRKACCARRAAAAVLSSAFARVESHSGWWTSWSTTPARVGVDDRRRGLAQQRTEAAAKEPIAQGIRLNA